MSARHADLGVQGSETLEAQCDECLEVRGLGELIFFGWFAGCLVWLVWLVRLAGWLIRFGSFGSFGWFAGWFDWLVPPQLDQYSRL